LLVMSQPPGSCGVQGLIYNKILPYMEVNGWELHFAGPSPALSSVLTERLAYPKERLHYTNNISASRQFSIRKNRNKRGSPAYFIYGFLQLLSSTIERLSGHDGSAYLNAGLLQQITAADRRWNFDLIAGKSPDFRILEAVGRLTREIDKPFVAMITDPHGHRDSTGFYPADSERQAELLAQCCGAMFMSPLTRQRYIQTGMISEEKTYALTDSYPADTTLYKPGHSALKPISPTGSLLPRRKCFAHLGVLPLWRPVDTLFEAVRTYYKNSPAIELEFNFFSYVYPQALESMQKDPQLSNSFRCFPAVDYQQSHWLAEDSDIQLVVIGPRHIDNMPSKFFEYLGHAKPVLVIGPVGNPIQSIVEELGIGIYANIEDSNSILNALNHLVNDSEQYRRSYALRHSEVSRYSSFEVAAHWSHVLDSMHTRIQATPPAAKQNR